MKIENIIKSWESLGIGLYIGWIALLNNGREFSDLITIVCLLNVLFLMMIFLTRGIKQLIIAFR